MSMIYSIDIKLYGVCDEANIAKILERGSKKGFRYYDEIGETKTSIPSLLDPKTTAQKVIVAYKTKPEFGPSVHTNLENETCAYLGFYKDDGNLVFHMGAISCPKKKGYFIDFDYYIRMCLDICQDFPILELKTTMI